MAKKYLSKAKKNIRHIYMCCIFNISGRPFETFIIILYIGHKQHDENVNSSSTSGL